MGLWLSKSSNDVIVSASGKFIYILQIQTKSDHVCCCSLKNTTYHEALYAAWGSQNPSRSAMPSISRLQKLVEAAWAQGFDLQGSDQLGCKLHNTRKWIGATEIVTVLSWLRINCQLIDFHRPTSSDGRHPELFNWVLKYFEDQKQQPPLYLQHQGEYLLSV